MSDVPDPTSPQMKATDTTNYLLGGIGAKLDIVLGNQSNYDERLRAVEAVIAALPKRYPWFSIVTGIAGIAALVGFALTFIIHTP